MLLQNGEEVANFMPRGTLLVVPKNIWHRFESPKGVKVMTITPQPTDHSVDRPE
jgi:mannose-6-phosphate isomerase-like protein (cupin superfamily)